VTKSRYDVKDFKAKALQWASSFDVAGCLDSNNFADQYSCFDVLMAIGVKDELITKAGDAFEELETFRKKHPGWITGFLSYDLKNEIEDLSSKNVENLQFPDLYFFVPRHLIVIRGNEIEIISDNPDSVFETIQQQILYSPHEASEPALKLQSRLSKADYLNAVETIKLHIARGDMYVTNFCQEFFAESAIIDPLAIFMKLNKISPNPFAAYFKWKSNYILCASPERFLAKRGKKLISQPIKGTAKRGKDNAEDEALKLELRNQVKELQENVMIVDLVRNDLTRSAKRGSVQTEELFGIYSFKQVHQMISTIVCELDNDCTEIQAIKNTFPMGSMTGAPKISSMQLMEQYENSRRGVYSGAIGYFSPEGNFDFNVVIRSILYNQQKQYLSFHVGSAITYDAVSEKEYEECMLKSQAILEVLGQV